MSDNQKTKAIKFILREVVLSYPQVFIAKQVQGSGEFYYSASFLLGTTSQAGQINEMIQACTRVADETWPDGTWRAKRATRNEMLFHWPIRDGAEKADKAGYNGRTFIGARSKLKPGVVDQHVQPVMDAERIYPGLIVNASVNFFGYRKPRWGIGVSLNNIQIVRDGERLGGKPDPSDDFTPIDFPENDNVPAQEDWLA